MTTATNVARCLIRLAGQDPEGEPMTAMRLQKLLYYCQGWHLAWYGRPLFEDRVEAWTHGPVVPSIYDLYKNQGRDPLPDTGEADGLPAEERASVEQVWGHYGRFSTIGLRDLTHDETPWRSHYAPDDQGRCTAEIPATELAAYFGSEYQRRTGDIPGGWGQSDLRPTVSLSQLRQELGC